MKKPTKKRTRKPAKLTAWQQDVERKLAIAGESITLLDRYTAHALADIATLSARVSKTEAAICALSTRIDNQRLDLGRRFDASDAALGERVNELAEVSRNNAKQIDLIVAKVKQVEAAATTPLRGVTFISPGTL